MAIILFISFPQIWQHSSSAHSELTLVAILHLALPASSTWAALGIGSQAFILGLGIRILREFLSKFSFASKLLLAFLYDRKQRTYLPLSVIIIISTILFLPILLTIILLSAAMSAPLMPLFTLPIFFISYPRPRRFWPSLIDYGRAHSSSVDAVYYQHASSELVRVLARTLSSGAVSVESPGSCFLLRFQDRLAVAVILEQGFGFCTLNVRGLELQETSCHTIEATRIDDIFESKSWLNRHFFNTFQPVDSAVIKVYSDARNVLTGIIDQPEALQRFSPNLLKVLVWVFLQHFLQESSAKSLSQTVTGSDNAEQVNCDSGFAGSILEQRVKIFEVVESEENRHSPPGQSLSWSDSVSTLAEEPSPDQHIPMPDHTLFDLPGLLPQDRPLESPDPVFTSRGLDAGATNDQPVPVSATPVPSHPKHRRTKDANKVHPDVRSTLGVSVPKWSNLPVQPHRLTELLREFPTEWLSHITGSTQRLDASLEEHLKKVAMTCYSLVDVPCSSRHSGYKEQTKPFDIFSNFSGRFPYSPGVAWLKEDGALHNLVLKAYRYVYCDTCVPR